MDIHTADTRDGARVRLLRIPEVARALGISDRYARELALRQRIRSVKIGTALRVPVDEVDRVAREGL